MAATVESFFRDSGNSTSWETYKPSPDSLQNLHRQFSRAPSETNITFGGDSKPPYHQGALPSHQISPYGSGEMQPSYGTGDMNTYGSPQAAAPAAFFQQQRPSRFVEQLVQPRPNLMPAFNQSFQPFQGNQSAQLGTTSCRYTSWTGQGHSAMDGLECIDDEYELDEEEDLEIAAATLRKLTMPSATEDSSGLTNPFSWKELEQSCRKLDEAHIRIEEIDLTHCEADPDLSPTAPKGLYNFRLQVCPEEEASAEAAVDETEKALHSILHDSRDSPANSSSGFSIGASSGTSSIAAPEVKGPFESVLDQGMPTAAAPLPESLVVTGISAVENRPTSPSFKQLQQQQSQTGPVEPHGALSQGPGPKGKKMSSILKTVRERCGLLFTSSGKSRRKPGLA